MDETQAIAPEGVEAPTSKLRVFFHFLPIVYSTYLFIASTAFGVIDFDLPEGSASANLLLGAMCVLLFPMAAFIYFRPIGKSSRRILEACGDVWGGAALIATAILVGLLLAGQETTWAAATAAGSFWNGYNSLPRLAMWATGKTPPPWGAVHRAPV